jgi:hypothetical protein
MNSQTAQEKLANLEESIAEGVLEVEFQGRRVKYRSLDDMRRIANGLRRDINNSRDGGGIRTTIAVFEKY